MQTKYIYINFLFGALLMPLSNKGQNLIRDPGFEEVALVLEDGDTVYAYNHWTPLLKFKKLSPRGLPIFSNYSKRYSQDKSFHYWIPYKGDSYLFSHIVYFRNLYQTELLEELIPGKLYTINFKYKIGADGFSKEKIESSINNKIGVLLTNKDMSDSSGLSIMKNLKISLNPQISIKAFNADSIYKWVDFTYYYRADKPYKYFIIGNFQKLIEDYELGYHPITGVGYKIDEVSIEMVTSDPSNSELILNVSKLHEVSQKPVTSELVLAGEMSDSIRNYYNHIHKAEEFIIQNILDSSIIEYHKAFIYKPSFFRDRRNAKKVIQLYPLFDSLLIINYLPSKHPSYTRNQLIITQIDSIYNLDQLCRNNNQNISHQDSLNFVFVDKLIKNEVISEETIGVNGMTKLNTILFHLSRYKYFPLIAQELIKEVAVGNHDNRQFASLVDSYYENNITFDKTKTYYLTNSSFPLYTKFITPTITIDQNKAINNNRLQLGLEDLQGQYKKQFYNFTYGYKDFEFYQIINYFPFDIESEDWNNAEYLQKEATIEQDLAVKYGIMTVWNR